MILKALFMILLSTFMLASNICKKEFESVPEAKEYIRIMKHIEEHHSSCDVVYAYGLFLNDPIMMNELEDDMVFAEELGAFAKKYSYLSQLINDKETFEYFNKKYDTDKRNIDEAVKYAFKNDIKNDNYVNLTYLYFALAIVGDTYTDEGLKNTILHLKAAYTPENLETAFPLWKDYRKKYKNITVSKEIFFQNFEQLVHSYSFPLLKKLQMYQDYIYPILLPEKYGDTKYIYAIKALMNTMKGKSLEKQLFFLKNSYIDIQVALVSGYSKDDVVGFYKNYLKREFIQRFSDLTQYQKAGLVMLVGDHLDAKLDWMKLDSQTYRKVTTTILKTKDIESLINTLGLYNYASALLERMPSKNEKKMLLNLLKLPSKKNDIVQNLSLIYTLGENTAYFNAIINKNGDMEKKDKYIEMLYERQSGESILSLFSKGNRRGLTDNEEKVIKEAFIKQVNRLVATPYDEIHDLTSDEKVDIALDVADYASYAMIIVPGVGIAANIGKSLLVNGIKTTVKNVAKAGVQEVIGSYNSIKNGMKTSYYALKSSAKKTWKNTLKKNGSSSNPINYHLRGGTHPVTGVQYNRLGFPKFDSKFNCRLPFHLVHAGEMKQFKYCTNKLREYIKRHPDYKKNFSKQQLKEINSKKPRIDKFTWHHHQAKSQRLLQLVDKEIHDKTAHTGGRAVFGGGKAGRMGKLEASKKENFVKNFFTNQSLTNQLLIASQSAKYGEKYFSAVKKATTISPKVLKNLKFTDTKRALGNLSTREVQTRFVDTLNKTGKYGWKRLNDIGNIMMKYPKSTAASAAYMWYVTDPKSFEATLKNSGKTLTEFVMTSVASVANGAGNVVVDKSKKLYDSKLNEISAKIESKMQEEMPYLIKSITILLLLLLSFFIWHRRNSLLNLILKPNKKQHTNYKENDHEY